jgi:colicin import membrane protein
MKKILIIALSFIFSTSIYSQTVKTKVSQTVTKTEVKLKKDGTPDQRYKNEVVKSKITETKQTAKAKAAEKKVTDKETGKFRGKKLYSGPNGGKYYINFKGNKTYIKQ